MPWADAPVLPEGEKIAFYQRAMTDEENQELENHRQKLRKNLMTTLVSSVFITALIVRFIESIWQQQIASGLSPTAWLVVLVVGIIYPVLRLRTWLALGRDLETKQIISVWQVTEDGMDELMIEELLPRVKLSWSEGTLPAYWRVC